MYGGDGCMSHMMAVWVMFIAVEVMVIAFRGMVMAL